MQIGMIGLGRMGANMVRRLIRGGHACVVHDVSAAAVQTLVREGASGATALDAFVQQLAKPRVVWLMVPAGAPPGPPRSPPPPPPPRGPPLHRREPHLPPRPQPPRPPP